MHYQHIQLKDVLINCTEIESIKKCLEFITQLCQTWGKYHVVTIMTTIVTRIKNDLPEFSIEGIICKVLKAYCLVEQNKVKSGFHIFCEQ